VTLTPREQEMCDLRAELLITQQHCVQAFKRLDEVKAEARDNYEQGFKLGIKNRLIIDALWRDYRGSLTYGEFYMQWFKKHNEMGKS